MKQGSVKFSKEFITPIGLKEWVGIEYPVDFEKDDIQEAFNYAKREVMKSQASTLGVPISSLPGPPNEIPVINKAEERLGILIENAFSMEELLKYKNDLSSPYLADLYSTKLSMLNK